MCAMCAASCFLLMIGPMAVSAWLGFAVLQAFDLCHETIDEFVVHFGIDDDAVAAHADLTLVQESPTTVGARRMFDIGVVENHTRRISAKLKRDTFQCLGRSSPVPRHAGQPGLSR